MNRRGFFGLLASVVVTPFTPLTFPLRAIGNEGFKDGTEAWQAFDFPVTYGRWGGVQAYWLDEGSSPAHARPADIARYLESMRNGIIDVRSIKDKEQEMPYKLPSPCITPLCPALSLRARCPQHELEHKRTRNRIHNAGRPSAARMGYGHEWRKIRAQVLAEQPWCATGCGRPSKHVDHIRPLRAGGTDERSNLIGMCHRCHSRKTAKFDGGFGHPSKIRGS